ncbi:hypothetical protein ACFFYR_15550, partial [Paraburkholderia dipogonis]|uniref:hypothetical protein n=1 Tax=Paraburkholderia dipogonis TaxID=1211383 RepID=UPI0035E606F0
FDPLMFCVWPICGSSERVMIVRFLSFNLLQCNPFTQFVSASTTSIVGRRLGDGYDTFHARPSAADRFPSVDDSQIDQRRGLVSPTAALVASMRFPRRREVHAELPAMRLASRSLCAYRARVGVAGEHVERGVESMR